MRYAGAVEWKLSTGGVFPVVPHPRPCSYDVVQQYSDSVTIARCPSKYPAEEMASRRTAGSDPARLLVALLLLLTLGPASSWSFYTAPEGEISLPCSRSVVLSYLLGRSDPPVNL